MAYTISLSLVLYAFWLVLSGYFTPFLLTLGAACAVGVALFAYRMQVLDHEGHPIHLGPRALTYWPWLMKEIAKSAWDVSRIILSPRLPISPTLIRARASQKTVVGQVTYANSITLTPGTITVGVEGDQFVVHALTREGAEGVLSGDMDRRVSQFEGSA